MPKKPFFYATIFIGIALATFVFVPGVRAQSVGDLQAQIASLTQYLQYLQSLVGGQNGNSLYVASSYYPYNTTYNTNYSYGGYGSYGGYYNYSRTMSIGATGADVTALQQFLMSQGTWVDGSTGQETNYFGPVTEASLARWQSQHGLVASGNFDQVTRQAVMNGGSGNCGYDTSYAYNYNNGYNNNYYGNYQYPYNQYSYGSNCYPYSNSYSSYYPYNYNTTYNYQYQYQNQNCYQYSSSYYNNCGYTNYNSYNNGYGGYYNGSLNVTMNQNFSGDTVRAGDTNVRIGAYTLFAPQGEDIYVRSVVVQLGQEGNQLRNLRVRVNGTSFDTISGGLSSNSSYTVSNGNTVRISSGTTANIDIFADGVAVTTPGIYGNATTLGSMYATGVSSGATYTSVPVMGQAVTIR